MSTTILMIEDDERNRYLATFLLEKSGFAVESAVDGPAGLVRAASLRPDLILLDIQLPGMDGYEVARRLKSDPTLAAIPIVAVTSYAMVGDRDRAMISGCDGYIEKPIDPARFVGEIFRFLPGNG